MLQIRDIAASSDHPIRYAAPQGFDLMCGAISKIRSSHFKLQLPSMPLSPTLHAFARPAQAGNVSRQPALPIERQRRGGFEMKGIVLWLMGVPLIAIILLYMFVF
ncbi:hypothetical protein [Ensifer sp. 4252]|uniref:hypothetical protein n=1 Tax=Ensifer sp. 4252 TaxID=3373915 RepID=UPI003D1BD26D